MSEYKGIKGFQVHTRTDDPTPTEQQSGDFYYNSTTGQYKNIVVGTATWSAGGAMNTSRYYQGGFGAQTAALVFGGSRTPGGIQALTEEYNGSSWSEKGDLGQARYNMAAFGTSYTSGIAAGGNP